MTSFEKERKNSRRKRKHSVKDRWTLTRVVRKDLKNKAPKITAEVNDHIYIYIYIYIYALKGIGQQRDLFLSYLFFFDKCFWYFTHSSESEMFYSCISFDLSCSQCFDNIVIHFKSRICVCEFSVRVNSPWQIVVSYFSFFFFFFFFFLQKCFLSVCVLLSMYVYIHSFFFIVVYLL